MGGKAAPKLTKKQMQVRGGPRLRQIQAIPPEEVEKLQEIPPDEVKLMAAKLYGRGYPRRQISRALLEQLTPGSKARTEEQKLSQARAKLRRWEMSQDFRDMVWDNAVVELDMSTPGILVGLAKKGKRGRVDAARLALEITGRHSAKGEGAVTNVVVQVAQIPRPESS